MKSKYYKDFSKEEIEEGFSYMKKEIENSPFFVSNLVNEAMCEFSKGNFSYDGATFVNERSKKTIFESASFVHDMFNYKGYIGYKVDLLFVLIMIILNYKKKQVYLRSFLMFIGTWINILRHKYYVKDYKGDIDITNYIYNHEF